VKFRAGGVSNPGPYPDASDREVAGTAGLTALRLPALSAAAEGLIP